MRSEVRAEFSRSQALDAVVENINTLADYIVDELPDIDEDDGRRRRLSRPIRRAGRVRARARRRRVLAAPPDGDISRPVGPVSNGPCAQNYRPGGPVRPADRRRRLKNDRSQDRAGSLRPQAALPRSPGGLGARVPGLEHLEP